jgi:hypothetical protein
MSTDVPHPVPAPDPTGADHVPSPVMAMLSDGLPLTLLLDLALGVRSSEVYVAEPPDLSWLSPAAVSRAG